MTSKRPFLIPSPRTPNTQHLPTLPIYSDFLNSTSGGTGSFSGMDSRNPAAADNSINVEPTTLNSTSLRSVSSLQSKASQNNSVWEVSFGDVGSKPVRYGSRGADSEALSMSQKELNEENVRVVYIDDVAKTNERFAFSGNSIRTAKYSIFTFLPRNLFEQFHRVAYIYFLVIAVLNQLTQLAVLAVEFPYCHWHLCFLLLLLRMPTRTIGGIDLIELRTIVWHQFWLVTSSSRKSEAIPCDMVLLSTSDPTRVAYVLTINLDGESNLKTRYAKQETLSKLPDKEKITGLIKCENPNRNIYGFHAFMEIDGKRLSLGPSNIVLRGCELKNTHWALGVAVYAGRETKVMLNSSGAPSKRNRLET